MSYLISIFIKAINNNDIIIKAYKAVHPQFKLVYFILQTRRGADSSEVDMSPLGLRVHTNSHWLAQGF